MNKQRKVLIGILLVVAAVAAGSFVFLRTREEPTDSEAAQAAARAAQEAAAKAQTTAPQPAGAVEARPPSRETFGK